MTPRAIARTALGVIAVVVVLVLLYQGYWWLRSDTTDRQVGVDNRNTGTQTAWRDEAIDLINEADLLDQGPQREALERQACDLIGRLTDNYRTDDRLVAFEEAECL